MRLFLRLSLLIATLILGVGCGGGGVKPRDIEVKPSNDPLVPARAALNRYASGEPLGSEVTGFPSLVDNVRKVDPGRADILEKGLAEIQKTPAKRASIAKDLLQKLQPSMK